MDGGIAPIKVHSRSKVLRSINPYNGGNPMDKTREMRPIFKHENCCDRTVYIGHVHTKHTASDVYYCPKRLLIYIRDEHMPASDCLIGTLDDLQSDILSGIRGSVAHMAAYHMIWEYLSPPEHYVNGNDC